VTISSAPWRAAGVLLIAAGLVATAAAALHWSPCLGVSFDSAACMDRQHDYRYFLPLEHSFGWQPVWPAPQLTASAAILAGGGWLFAQAGMKLSWSARVGAVLCATLPLAFGCQLMVGLIAGPAAAGELQATIGLLSVAVRDQRLAGGCRTSRRPRPGLARGGSGPAGGECLGRAGRCAGLHHREHGLRVP